MANFNYGMHIIQTYTEQSVQMRQNAHWEVWESDHERESSNKMTAY